MTFLTIFEGRLKKENRMGRKLTGSFILISAPHTIGIVNSYQPLPVWGVYPYYTVFSDF